MHRALLPAARRRAHLTAPCPARHGTRRQNFATQRQDGQPSHRPSSKSNNDWRQSTTPPAPGTPAHELDQVSSLYEHNFAQPTLSSLDFFRRALKLSATLLALVVGTTFTAFEGAHMYVEHRALAPTPDADDALRRYGWDIESDRWTGGEGGGTDPGLGWKARHAVRSAWIAQNWGTGSQVLASGAIGSAARDNGPVEAQLEYAHDFLNIALAIALERTADAAKSGKPSGLRAETLTDLLTRHASTLERIGSRGALYDSRSEYERVYAGLPVNQSTGGDGKRARIALKLGNISARLGEDEEALEWWARALALASDTSDISVDNTSSHDALARSQPSDRNQADSIVQIPSIPARLPTSPLAQRTLAATLSSLSAYYAQTGRLKDAKDVQEAGLRLLKTAGTVPSSASEAEGNPPAGSLNSNPRSSLTASSSSVSESPARALHELFLLHRTSLLSLHHAEVSYALRSASSASSLVALTHAAAVSEQIALLLTGSSLTHPDAPASRVPAPPAPDAKLDARYVAGAVLGSPAKALLRDARRTAMQAWTLRGVLLERTAGTGESTSISNPHSRKSKKGSESIATDTVTADASKSKAEALACYERALGWAGVKADEQGGIGQPGEGTLDSEWQALWGSYTRLRDELRRAESPDKKALGKA